MKDSFGRDITYLRLSVTDLCNLRCRYCMPEEGVCKRDHSEMLTQDEMISAVRAAASLGITKLRVTGGEPLVKKDILTLCRRAAETDGIKEVCITTNGTLLEDMAVPLRQAGVRRINISLDTLDPEKYARMTRRGSLDMAAAGIRAALAAGFDKVKLNAVLIGGFNDDEIPILAGLTLKYPLDVRFIELMPMGEGGFTEKAYIPCARVLQALPELEPVPVIGGTASLYRLPGALGDVGLISPVSSHFCGSCDRLRLTADGKLKPCLHSSDEYPIKGLDEAGMAEVMRRAIEGKPAMHGKLGFGNLSGANRTMNRIGG